MEHDDTDEQLKRMNELKEPTIQRFAGDPYIKKQILRILLIGFVSIAVMFVMARGGNPWKVFGYAVFYVILTTFAQIAALFINSMKQVQDDLRESGPDSN